MLQGAVEIRRKVESEIDNIIGIVDNILFVKRSFNRNYARNIITDVKKEQFDFFVDDVEDNVIEGLRMYCSGEVSIEKLCSDLEIFKKALIEFKKRLLSL